MEGSLLEEEDGPSVVFVAKAPPGSAASKNKYKRPLVFLGSIASIVVIVIAVVYLTYQIDGAETLPSDPLERAMKLMEKTPLMDTHNDLPWQYRMRVSNNITALPIQDDLVNLLPILHTDIPRIKKGRLGAQIWSVYVSCGMPDPVQATMEQIDDVYRMTVAYPNYFKFVTNSGDIVPTFKDGKFPSLIGMEGGHSINSSMGALRAFYYLGARYMTLTHTCSTPWAQSANDDSGDVIGLTPYGRQIVQEMNRIGMMVDLSHVAVQTMYDALNTTTAPVIFSHSNARALCDHIRNVPDDVLRLLPANGGVVQVVFYPAFVCNRYREKEIEWSLFPGCNDSCVAEHMAEYQNSSLACNVSDVADHIDHIRNVSGIDHVGIGSDYDGVSVVPVGLEDVSKYPNLIAELITRGYSDDDINKVLSGNIIRVMQQVEAEAQRLQQSDPVGLAPAIGPNS